MGQRLRVLSQSWTQLDSVACWDGSWVLTRGLALVIWNCRDGTLAIFAEGRLPFGPCTSALYSFPRIRSYCPAPLREVFSFKESWHK